MRALGILRKGLCLGLLLNLVLAASALAQKALTWQEVRDRFEALNPTLRAGLIGIDESKASEITAYLRPNPNLAVTTDGIQAAPYQGVWQPLRGATISPNISYLHERRHKRELRLESAQKATIPARSEEHTSELQSHSDLVCRLLLEKKKKKQNEMQRQHQRAPVRQA